MKAMKCSICWKWFEVSSKLLLVSICLLPLKTFAGDLKIGAAAVKITPPIGIPMAGYYYRTRSRKNS